MQGRKEPDAAFEKARLDFYESLAVDAVDGKWDYVPTAPGVARFRMEAHTFGARVAPDNNAGFGPAIRYLLADMAEKDAAGIRLVIRQEIEVLLP